MPYTNITGLLFDTAARFPGRTAFQDDTESITYSELLECCITGASALRRLAGIDDAVRNVPIAILIDRNIRSLILFMTVVMSGCFYVPIDPSLPKGRIDLILGTLKPRLIIAGAKRRVKELDYITWEDFQEELAREKESHSFEECEQKVRSLLSRMIDTDPLYAIFTSGTTGVPKGVLISHRSVLDLVTQFGKTFSFPEYPVFGNQAPFDFDVSVKDIYNSIRLGGTVTVIPKSYFVMPSALLPYLQEKKVNVLIWAVSAMRIVQNFKCFEACLPDALELVMFSGEVMPVRCLNYWQEHLPKAAFVNLYGPTEITCNCNYYIVDRTFSDTDVLPLGAAFENSEVFLMNPDTGERISEPGLTGEICVKGSCLALGYYNNPEQTAKSFVQDPAVTEYPSRVYLTGDLGRYSDRGELYYVSRRDHQIKHMGHRIELSEIEVCVNAVEEVQMACCIFHEEAEQIVLCYAAASPCDELIRSALKTTLPAYMIPGRFIFMEALPLNEHAKIDRRGLLNMIKDGLQ